MRNCHVGGGHLESISGGLDSIHKSLLLSQIEGKLN